MSFLNNDEESYKKALYNSKDDLYNLSIRKKVCTICQKIISTIDALEICYQKITDEDQNIQKFIDENKQIQIICEKIYKTVAVKDKKTRTVKEYEENTDIRLYICALLSQIADGIIALSNIISIRHIERELIYASEIILRQLIHILPYKIY